MTVIREFEEGDDSPIATKVLTGLLFIGLPLIFILMGVLIGMAINIEKADASTPKIFITSYNPQKGQTDDSPCTGASGRNLCTAAKEGDRVIAVSRDLLKRNGGLFKWHDKVKVTSEIPQCNGIYSVEDTMNKRFKARADLFFLDRKDNTSCTGTIEKVSLSR